jgi:hypothetical protein
VDFDDDFADQINRIAACLPRFPPALERVDAAQR